MASRKLEIKIVGDSKSLERTFGRAGTSADGFASKLTSAGKRGAIALGGMGIVAGGLGAKMVSLAGDAAEVDSKFNIVFGQNVPRLQKNLDAFSEATGASRYELKQQAADMGALLSPILQNADATAGLSEEMVKLAVDLGSFNNIPVAAALEKIRAGLVGEAEPLRSVGVLLSEAAVKQEAYRAGIARTGSELTEQQKVQARANLILAQTKLAQGDATRTSDSYANQMKRLRNELTDTGTDIGRIFLPAVTRVVSEINDAIPAVVDWGGALADDLKPKLDDLAGWARDHKDEFTDFFDEARENAEDFAGALGKGASGTEGVVGAMGGWDDAFTLLLTGALAAKLKTAATRAGGLAGALKKIKGFGPVLALSVLVDFLVSGDKNKVKAYAERGQLGSAMLELVGLSGLAANPLLGGDPTTFASGGDPAVTTASGTVADPRGGSLGSTAGKVTTSSGVTAPKAHVIAFVKRVAGIYGAPLNISSGVRLGATVKGTNGRPSQHGTGDAGDIGPYSGETLIRIGQAALVAAGMSPAEAYTKTSFVGTVNGVNILFNTMVGGNHFNHVHVGLRSLPASSSDSSTNVTPDGSTSSTGATTAPTTKAKTPPLIPLQMQEALAKAEGTKTIDDDLTAKMVVAKYLERELAKAKGIERRIELREALNDVRSQIADINQDAAEKRKQLDAADLVRFDNLKEKLRDAFAEAIERARERVVAARDGFGSAFGTIADKLRTVFDAKTEQLLAKARARVEKFGFTIGAGEETPAEQRLRAFREQRAAEERARRRAAATTPEELAALDLEDTERGLEALAAAERQAADEALTAERKRIENERAAKKEGFAAELSDLEARWATTNATAEQRTAELHALLAKYELPFAEVGSLVGDAFASSFLTALQKAFDRLDELRAAMSAVSPAMAAEAAHAAAKASGLSPAEAALAARSAAQNARYGLPVPGFADGVSNFSGGLALVGERGPELLRLPRGSDVIPNHRLGGITVNVAITGPVLGRSPEVAREIARLIKPELDRQIGFERA